MLYISIDYKPMLKQDMQEVHTEQDSFSQPGDQSFSGDQEAVLSDSVQTKSPMKVKRSAAIVSDVSNEIPQPEPNVSSVPEQMRMMKNEAKATGAEMASGTVQEDMQAEMRAYKQVMGGQQEHTTAALARGSAEQKGNKTDRYQDFLTLISAFCSDTEGKNAVTPLVTPFETLVKRGRDLMKSDDRMDFDQKTVVEQIVILLEKEDFDKGIDRKKLCERLKEPAGLKEPDR